MGPVRLSRIGKSFLAQALIYSAIRAGRTRRAWGVQAPG